MPIRIGVDSIGVPAFLPGLIAAFSKKYPNYRIITVRLEKDQEPSGADLYFLPWYNATMKNRITLLKDRGCILVSRDLLEQVFGAETEYILKLPNKEMSESLISHVPFLDAAEKIGKLPELNSISGSNLQGLHFSSDVDMDYKLCLNGIGALFAPEQDIVTRLAGEIPEIANKMLILPLIDVPFPSLTISYEDSHAISEPEKLFIDFAAEFFS